MGVPQKPLDVTNSAHKWALGTLVPVQSKTRPVEPDYLIKQEIG
jgi:hypothetical protein